VGRRASDGFGRLDAKRSERRAAGVSGARPPSAWLGREQPRSLDRLTLPDVWTRPAAAGDQRWSGVGMAHPKEVVRVVSGEGGEKPGALLLCPARGRLTSVVDGRVLETGGAATIRARGEVSACQLGRERREESNSRE
jgi:hypothetical protein